LAALLLERTGGNPFFIEEACRTLAEEGAVRVEAGRAELTQPLARVALPETVQAVIRARLDRLEPEARQVLRLAAVIGREFDQRLLERIVPGPQHLPAMLETLRALELIQQARVLPERVWRFKHALTQEVAYESLLRSRRRDVHARVARAIEELYGDRIEEQVGLLVHHYGLAEEWEAAVRYGRMAAERALTLYQYELVRRRCEECLGQLAHLGDHRELRELRVDFEWMLAESLLDVGDWQRADEVCRRAERVAQELGDRVRMGRLFIHWGRAHIHRSDGKLRARELLEQAVELLGSTEALHYTLTARQILGATYLGEGMWLHAEPHLSHALAANEGLQLPAPLCAAQAGYTQAVLGRCDVADVSFGKGLRRAQLDAATLPVQTMIAGWHGQYIALIGEDRHKALERTEALAEKTARANSPWLMLGCRLAQANAAIGLQRWDAAHTACESALQAMAQLATRTGHAANLIYDPALLRLLQGDATGAEEARREGLPLAENSPHWWGPRYEFLHGLLLAAGDPPGFEEAIAAYERSIAGDEEVGAVVPAAQTRYHLAMLLGRHGGHERVRAMLDELIGQFAAWGIPVWEARCRQALSRLPAS
jgi:tetratricopeptide (TPR) repeat protein